VITYSYSNLLDGSLGGGLDAPTIRAAHPGGARPLGQRRAASVRRGPRLRPAAEHSGLRPQQQADAPPRANIPIDGANNTLAYG